MSFMIKVLMIEDDIELATLLKERIDSERIQMYLAFTPSDGMKMFQEGHHDLLVLDLSLPQMDGLDVCSRVRKKSDIPIIISSARSDMTDKAAGFSLGVDDYLPKPYDPEELVFRIEAIMRRSKKLPDSSKKPFELVEESHEIRKYGDELKLTPAEYEITAYMMSKERQVVSREELLLNIATINYESSFKSIDVIIGRIRQKLGDDPKQPTYILPVRGVGYKFVNQ